MSERHIGTMTQAEQDVAMIRHTLQAFSNVGHNVGDSLGALVRFEERLERAERIVEAAHDPFLVVLESHPNAGEPANAEMSRAATRFREALAAHQQNDPSPTASAE